MPLTKGLALIRARKLFGQRAYVEENPRAPKDAAERAAIAGQLDEAKRIAADIAKQLAGEVGELGSGAIPTARADRMLFEVCSEVAADLSGANERTRVHDAVERCRRVRELVEEKKHFDRQIRELQSKRSAERCSIGTIDNIGGMGIGWIRLQLGAGDDWESAFAAAERKR